MNASKAEAESLPALGRNLTFGLFDRLGRAIVSGQYERIPFPTEVDLVRQYGVSLGVIREALKMLAAKGLLGARPRHGTLVEPQGGWNLLDADILRWLVERRASPDLLRRFNELRAAIEPEAAALAASAAGCDDHVRIEQGLKRIAAARSGGDNAAQADIAFHRAILTAVRNPFYAQFRELLTTALRASAQVPGRNRGIADHVAVFDAIRGGDVDRARRHMRAIVTRP